MQILYKVSIITLLFLSQVNTYGQDMHFTNNDIVPTFYNPALSGNFAGTVRAGLIFRDQHELTKQGANAEPFRTFGLGVDIPLIYGFKKTHWVGAGLTMMSDNVGLGSGPSGGETLASPISQKWTRFAPSVAYHIGLDKKMNSVFSIGVQYGLTTVAYDGRNAFTEGRYLGLDDPDIMRFSGGMDGISGNYGSINAGVTYKSKLNKTSNIILGAAVMHIQKPTFRLSGMNTAGASAFQEAAISQRINIHGAYSTATSKRLTVVPSFTASFMGSQTNIQLQFRTEYLTKKKGDFALIFGAGYRVSDAPQFLTGARYKDWLFTLSYDHSLTAVSEISPSTFELGASKVFTFNKKPDPKPIVYCPRI